MLLGRGIAHSSSYVAVVASEALALCEVEVNAIVIASVALYRGFAELSDDGRQPVRGAVERCGDAIFRVMASTWQSSCDIVPPRGWRRRAAVVHSFRWKFRNGNGNRRHRNPESDEALLLILKGSQCSWLRCKPDWKA